MHWRTPINSATRLPTELTLRPGGPSFGAAARRVAPIDGEEGLFLILAQRRIRANRCLSPLDGGVLRPRLIVAEKTGLGEQSRRGEIESLGDRLQDADRRLVKTALYLAQVRVRDIGHAGQLAQRQPRETPLRADEVAERLHLPLPSVLHFRVTHG